MKSKTIVVPQNMALAGLTSTEKHLRKHSLSPIQGSYDPNSVIGAYNSPYCYFPNATSGIPDCLPSGNPVEHVQSYLWSNIHL